MDPQDIQNQAAHVFAWAFPAADAIAIDVLSEPDGRAALDEWTGNPTLTRSILNLARAAEAKGSDIPLRLSLFTHLLIGTAATRNPATATSALARLARHGAATVLATAEALKAEAEGGAVGWNPVSAVTSAARTVGSAVESGARTVAKGVSTGAGEVKRAATKTVKVVKKAGGQVLSMGRDAIRRGLQAMFGKRVTDFLFNAADLLVTQAPRDAWTLLSASVRALQKVASGAPLDALKLLLIAVTETMIGPALAPIASVMGLSPTKFRRIVHAAAKRNKWLPLQLVSLFFSGVSANVQSVVTQSLSVLRPVLVAVVAEMGGGRDGRLIAKGIDFVATILIGVVNQVGSFDDLVTAAAAKLGARTREQLDRMKGLLRNALDSLTRFKLSEFSAIVLRVMREGDLSRVTGALTKPLDAARLLDTPSGQKMLARALAADSVRTRQLLLRVAPDAARFWI